MKLKQEKWIVVTDVPKDIRQVFTHGGFKPLAKYEAGISKGEIQLFENKYNAQVRMHNLFDDHTAFNYIRVEVEIEAVELENAKVLDVEFYLQRWETLLSIDGIDSKSKVRNEIKYLLNQIKEVKVE